ncbi:putative galactoside 2-alpha-L-fucosyltransferase 3 isoform [Sesbania bispinosa]|nr:putative galactoside 2-alpha-L-fucosyltransferase 3 isoform [Sesbania bispinosa]
MAVAAWCDNVAWLAGMKRALLGQQKLENLLLFPFLFCAFVLCIVLHLPGVVAGHCGRGCWPQLWVCVVVFPLHVVGFTRLKVISNHFYSHVSLTLHLHAEVKNAKFPTTTAVDDSKHAAMAVASWCDNVAWLAGMKRALLGQQKLENLLLFAFLFCAFVLCIVLHLPGVVAGHCGRGCWPQLWVCVVVFPLHVVGFTRLKVVR